MRGLDHRWTHNLGRQELLNAVLACGIADAVLLAVLIFFAFIDASAQSWR